MKNDTVGTTDYIRFGHGSKNLILLPGLGDGLRTVRGTAGPMRLLYRSFISNYTVYAFSRRNDILANATTRDMARDVKSCMDALGIEKADLWGVSMGGMIAQWMGVDYPEAIGKLVLTVTCAQPNPVITNAVTEWLGLAAAGDHTGLMDSNMRLIYSDAYYRKNKAYIPLVGAMMHPRSYDRFRILANACLTHNCAAYLERIQSQTLVIGGQLDQVVGPDAARELAAAIPGATLRIYPEQGHGLYDESNDFQTTVLSFLQSEL